MGPLRAFAVGIGAAILLFAPDEGCKSEDATCSVFDGSNYDQSCTTDSDCFEVTDPRVCCGDQAINVTARARYMAALSSEGTACLPARPCTAACAHSLSCCISGRCELTGDNMCRATTADSGAVDAGTDGYATLCPLFDGQPTCPAASNANGCNLALGYNCAANALPQGVACSGMSQCQARIGPVDGCGRVDGFICSCIDGRWSCDDCAIGGAVCEGGAQAYELPDSGTTGESVNGPADASAE